MINFIKDLIIFIKLKLNKSRCKVCFFCENKFIYKYLEPYILKKSKKNKILLFSFENLNKIKLDNIDLIVLKTKFFRELFFLTIKVKYLYSSTPDLENTFFKKTKLYNCKYIYLSHTPVSLNLIYNENAFDHFDAIQVTSRFQYNEMIEIIQNRKLKIKIFKYPYLFVKNQIKKLKYINKEKDILIAPSWNTGFFNLKCHKLLINQLNKTELTYAFRPHPMSIKKKEISYNELESLNCPIDNSTFLEFSKYNFFISDWSGIFIEYALIFKRKSYLINSEKKIVNKKYLNYKNIPIEISLRNKFAETYDVQNINLLINSILDANKKRKINGSFNEDLEIIDIINKNFY